MRPRSVVGRSSHSKTFAMQRYPVWQLDCVKPEWRFHVGEVPWTDEGQKLGILKVAACFNKCVALVKSNL